ncbi:CPBP family intramembrane glutamic endopeptidase [Tuberibacillus calidus]|uniref:CPBP family intramembrane glutamic endopeptidase n=1 Tax=Tuberibacillus calidus TaxID=340097 RepID=UPI00040FA6C8|nr:CPBP family intramembrane glutamic endopeptidase [Tuberibacillus calidus]
MNTHDSGSNGSIKNVHLRYFLLVLVIGIPLIYIMMLKLNGNLLNLNDPSYRFITITAIYILLYMACLRVMKKNNITLKGLVKIKKAFNIWEIIGLVFLVKVLVISTAATLFLLEGYSLIDSNFNDIDNPPVKEESSIEFIFDTIVAVLIAPFVEEIFFRGLIMQSWALRWGVKKGIVFSSILFSIMHLSPEFLDMFIGGIILSILFIKYQSLLISISFHAIYNVINVVLQIFTSGGNSNDPFTVDQFKATGWVGLIMFVISFIIFVIYLKKSKIHGILPIT